MDIQVGHLLLKIIDNRPNGLIVHSQHPHPSKFQVVIIIFHLLYAIKRIKKLKMVKLPENESYVPLPTGEMWARYQSNRNLYAHGGPSTLVELEEFADIAANYMSTMANYPNSRQIAMNRLRQFFNLEFKLRCDVCGTAHHQDEITAPER